MEEKKVTSKVAYKNGDVVRWWFTEETMQKHNRLGCGTLSYWCRTQVAIFTDGVFRDTYWTSGMYTFEPDQIGTVIGVEYVANLNQYEQAKEQNKVYYKDADCLDLNHANSTQGNFYIRKGAKRDAEKIKRVIQRNMKSVQREIASAQRRLVDYQKSLDNFDITAYVPREQGVSDEDTSYQDKEE